MGSDFKIIDLSEVGNYGQKAVGESSVPSHSMRQSSYSKSASCNDKLARSPKTDEFQRGARPEQRRSSQPKRNSSRYYDDKYDRRTNTQNRARSSSKNKEKLGVRKITRAAYENLTPEQKQEYRLERRRQRKIAVLKRRCAAAGAALALLMGGGVAINNAVNSGQNKDLTVEISTFDKYSDTFEYDCANDDDDFEYSDNKSFSDAAAIPTIIGENLNKVTDTIETKEAALEEAKKVQAVCEILENNPEIKEAFNDIEIALRRASIEYGGNIVDLLNEMDEKFGCGQLQPGLLACVMEKETGGFFTNWKTNQVLRGEDGDTGWFQITDVAEDDLPRMAKWLKRQGVSEEDIKDILYAGRDDMRGNAGRGAMKLAFLSSMFDNDMPRVLSAYNAGEGFANNGGIIKSYVKHCYNEHLAPLSEYEEIWDYILSRDYYAFEEDGVPHVYVNPSDGSVRYPR